MKQKDILLIVIPSFILVLAWIGFTIYDNSVSSTITPTINVQIEPISPDFDSTTIESIKKRTRVEPVYVLYPDEPEPTSSTPPQISPTPGQTEIVPLPTTQEPINQPPPSSSEELTEEPIEQP